MAQRSVAKGTARRAVRQPGANTTVPRRTNAGATGNVADGGGSGSNMLSGTPDGPGNGMGSGTP